MFGLFRKKNADGSDKLPGPKGVPDAVGSTLVVKFQEDPAWAWARGCIQSATARAVVPYAEPSEPMGECQRLPPPSTPPAT